MNSDEASVGPSFSVRGSNERVDSASTGAGGHGHVDVTSLTPARAPRVTDNVVRGGGLTVVTDCCDGVVA